MGAQPVSFSFEAREEGAHVKVTVRCGPDGSRALCGELTMRPGEWSLLRWLLDTTPPLQSNESYIPHFAQGQATVMYHTPIDMNPIVVRPDQWPTIVGERYDEAVAAARIAIDGDRVESGHARLAAAQALGLAIPETAVDR